MTRSGNDLLRQQDFVTYGTMLAFRQAGCGAGCRNGCIDHFSVAQSGNDLLRKQDFVTYGTMLTLGQAGVDAIGGNRCIGYFRVAQSGNDLLRQQDFVTNSAMLTLGQAGGSAGCRNGCINGFGVLTFGQNQDMQICEYGLALISIASITIGTMPILSHSFHLTGSRDFLHMNYVVNMRGSETVVTTIAVNVAFSIRLKHRAIGHYFTRRGLEIVDKIGNHIRFPHQVQMTVISTNMVLVGIVIPRNCHIHKAEAIIVKPTHLATAVLLMKH